MDEESIRALLCDFAATWNARDMGAFGRLFSPDADFVTITGNRLKGRADIQSYHTDLSAQVYKDSHLSWIPEDVRLVRPDVAVAHVSTEIAFNQGRDRRTSLALVVLSKQGGRWWIESLQNTLTGGPPPAAMPR